MGEVVQIHLGRALRLSETCFTSAIEIRRETELLLASLREAGEDSHLLGPALEASVWVMSGTRRVAAVIEAVVSWTEREPGTCPLWISPVALVDDPHAAGSAATDALAALRAGDLAGFARMARDWAGNADFSAALGARLGADDIVPWLAMASDPGADVASVDGGPLSVVDLVGLLADSLAAASSAGRLRLSLPDLLDAGAEQGLTPAGAAVLFAAPGDDDRTWSRDWLVDAAALIVVPLTNQVRDGDTRLVGREWGRGGQLMDLRVPIFEALVRDPASARAALASVDLRLLVGTSANFLDAGASITAALRVAARPGELDAAGAGIVMERLVAAVSEDDPPPLLLAERLGEIAWPWIGSFRIDQADDRPGGVPSLLPGPSEADLRRYVQVAGSNAKATTDLVGALDVWVAYQLAASGPGRVSPEVLHDLGAVARFVSEVRRDAARSDAVEADDDRSASQGLLELAGNGIGALVGKWWGDAVDFTISNLIVPRVVGPAVVADLDAEIEHLVTVPEWVARDQEVLEWQLLAHVWRRRAESRLFDALPSPPESILDPAGQLRPLIDLDGAALDEYEQWHDRVADATGVDNIGAAFGRDGAPSDGGG